MKRAPIAPAVTRARSALQAFLVAAFVLFVGAVLAQGVQPSPIPDELSAEDRRDLESRRTSLLQQREAMLAKIAGHNGKCGKVPENSPLVAECSGNQTMLAVEIRSYQNAVTEFNRLVNEKGPASPSRDPMVVDARNAPSGLPKALDNAIASAYASAPPGVSDRVLKGFQAVMDRDWKVAKAWFQDALNHDPTNAGLKRLVALSGSPQQPNSPRATVDARNEPAGLGGRSDVKGASAPPNNTKPVPASTSGAQVQQPVPNEIYLMFPGLKAIEDKWALDYLFGLDAH